MSRPSGCPLRRPPTGPSDSRPCSRRPCGSSMRASISLPRLLRALSTRPAEILGLAGGRLQRGAPADLIVFDPGRPLRARQAPAQVAVQEHALRRSPPGRTGDGDAGSGQDRLSTARYDVTRNECLTKPTFCTCWRALILGYLLGSIPFGVIFTRMAGSGDCGRSAPAISAPPTCCAQGAKGSPPRPCSAMPSRARSPCSSPRYGGHNSRPLRRSALSSGHLFPVWLGFKGGKGVATFIGVLIGLKPLAALAFAADLARGRLRHPLFVALGPDRERGDAHRPLAPRRARHGRVAVILVALLWWKHSREHQPPSRRDRRQDRAEGMSRMLLTDEQRLDWLRLIRSENVGPAHLSRADQPVSAAPPPRSKPCRISPAAADACC